MKNRFCFIIVTAVAAVTLVHSEKPLEARALPPPYETVYDPPEIPQAIDHGSSKQLLSPAMKLVSATNGLMTNLWSRLMGNELVRSLVASSLTPPRDLDKSESQPEVQRRQYQQPQTSFAYYEPSSSSSNGQSTSEKPSSIVKGGLSNFLPILTQLVMLWPTINKLLTSLRATDRGSSSSSYSQSSPASLIRPSSLSGFSPMSPAFGAGGYGAVDPVYSNEDSSVGIGAERYRQPLVSSQPSQQAPSPASALGSMALTLLGDLMAQHVGRIGADTRSQRKRRSSNIDEIRLPMDRLPTSVDVNRDNNGNKKHKSFVPLLTSAAYESVDYAPEVTANDRLVVGSAPTLTGAKLAPYSDDSVAATSSVMHNEHHMSESPPLYSHATLVDSIPAEPDQTGSEQPVAEQQSRANANQTAAEHELDIVKRYLLRIRPHQHDEYNDEIIATYLSCSGMSSTDDHCLERLACVFGDSGATFMLPLERDVTSIVIYSILRNAHVDSKFKARLKAAARAGNSNGSQCQSLYPCNKQQSK